MSLKHFYTGAFVDCDVEGIKLYSFDGKTLKYEEGKGSDHIKNPTYLWISDDKANLYCVSELDAKSKVCAFKINDDYSLTFLNSRDCDGGQVCNIACDKNKKYLACAGFEFGDVFVYKLCDDGSVGDEIFHVRNEGKSIHPERQAGAHAHCVSFRYDNGLFLYTTDLGLDRIYCYAIDGDNVELKYSFDTPEGRGPRHLLWNPLHKDILYVVCEISYTLLTYKISAIGAEFLNEEYCVSKGFDDFGGSAAVRIDKDAEYIYVSNRIMQEPFGRDNVCIFDLKDNMIPNNPTFFSVGKVPRDMILDDAYMYVGCMADNSLDIYELENKKPCRLICKADNTNICCISKILEN